MHEQKNSLWKPEEALSFSKRHWPETWGQNGRNETDPVDASLPTDTSGPSFGFMQGFPPSYKNRGQGYGVWQRKRETFNVIDEKSSAAPRLLEAKLVMTLRCDQDLWATAVSGTHFFRDILREPIHANSTFTACIWNHDYWGQHPPGLSLVFPPKKSSVWASLGGSQFGFGKQRVFFTHKHSRPSSC